MWRIRNLTLVKLVFLLLVCFGIPVSGAQPLLEQPDLEDNALRSGEVLEYSAKVRGIPAGTQIMQVNERKMLAGREVYHVQSVARVRKLFGVFYPFDNWSESFIHSRSFHPLQYRKKITDGGYKGNVVVDFDQVNQVAIIVKDQKRSELSIPEGIQDELSMIYLLRTKEIEVGQTYEFPALVGTKALNASIAVLRTEVLKTAFGTSRTIVVKAIPRDITVWLTSDAARIPVRIEASTKIGKLVFKLKKMR